MMETYRKIATVQAKLFERGDEDGFVHPNGMLGAMEDARYGIKSVVVPFIKTLENTHFTGEYGKNYLCVGVDGERWLVEKSIFERTYEKVKSEKGDVGEGSSCWCDNGIITCPGCNGEQSKGGVCAGCHGKGKVTCGKCGGKR